MGQKNGVPPTETSRHIHEQNLAQLTFSSYGAQTHTRHSEEMVIRCRNETGTLNESTMGTTLAFSYSTLFGSNKSNVVLDIVNSDIVDCKFTTE